MRGIEFLSVLTRAMPSHEDLVEYGLEADEIEDVQRTFKFVARDLSGSDLRPENELERMVIENDCSAVEVGLLRFLDEPRPHCHGKHVAFCEADPVVVKPGGSVVMYDHAGADKLLDCGADSERFLDALAAFLEVRHDKSKWKGRASEAADMCAKHAGGAEYTSFFRLLCGFLG